MANQVATQAAVDPAANPPSRAFTEPWARDLARAVCLQGGHPVLMMGYRLQPQHLTTLEHKQLTLNQRLTAGPTDGRLINAQLLKLLMAFPPRDTGAGIAGEVQAGVYLQAIAHRPAWGVRMAVDAIISGRLPNGKPCPYGKPWAPTPPEFALLIDDMMFPYRDDLMRLGWLLQIAKRPEFDPEIKAMVADGFDVLKTQFGGRHAPRAERRSEAEILAGLKDGVAARLKDHPRVKPKTPEPRPGEPMESA